MLPAVHKSEIEDKSEIDTLVRAVAIFQVVWAAGQVVIRLV